MSENCHAALPLLFSTEKASGEAISSQQCSGTGDGSNPATDPGLSRRVWSDGNSLSDALCCAPSVGKGNIVLPLLVDKD